MIKSDKREYRDDKLGIYVHIPFCVRKCRYCAFPSRAIGGNNTDKLEVLKTFGNALIVEISQMKNFVKSAKGDDHNVITVDTIFFGGGTPSLMPPGELENIMEAIRSNFNVLPGCEITLESNPGTLTLENLREYRKMGINRISMGVQSLQDMELKTLGRIHHKDQAIASYKLIREAGFENVNLDLMFGFPGQSLESWRDTLRQVADLDSEHISFYSLQLEEGTPLYDMYMKDEIAMPAEELDRAMYHEAAAFLKSQGYNHYEISNCAKVGYECRHNLRYWNLSDYLGLGPGAHSYIRGASEKGGGLRFANSPDLDAYMGALENGRRAFDITSENTRKDDMTDYIITAMRRSQGIVFSEFRQLFGCDFESAYEHMAEKIHHWEHLEFIRITKEGMGFTLKGVDVSNSILAEFV